LVNFKRLPFRYAKSCRFALKRNHKTRNMPKIQKFTAIIEREDDGYVSLCPELDIASQGSTKKEAKENLVEAIELFLEVADPTEVTKRLQKETFVTQLEVTVG
jgi:predicted RNase H-like HicB family nuclease